MTERNPPDPLPSDETPVAASRHTPRKPVDLGVLNEHVGYFARRLQVWIFQDFGRMLAKYDIRPAQFSVLVVIEANPGLSQADLADALGIQRPRLVLVLDDLERRGLTRRLRLPRDRRYHSLALTREGLRKLKRIKSLAALHEARLEEVLGPGKRDVLLPILREFTRAAPATA